MVKSICPSSKTKRARGVPFALVQDEAAFVP
jgi:hypothetical protein